MIVFGMVYVYLPFMLFPMTLGLSLVPRDLVDAAGDLGASRLQIWREVELPLAMPGILIGFLLTFVLAAGAVAEAKILGGQSIIVITHDIEIAFTYAQNWPLGAALAVLLDAGHRRADAPRPAPSRPRPHPGPALTMARRTDRWIAAWTGLVVVLIYLPVLCGLLASLGKSRYFTFPIRQWSFDWWQRTADSLEIGILVHTSLWHSPPAVTAIAVVLGFCGALAFARYDWRGRRLFQKLVLLPIFFPQPVLGLALLLWFNAVGVPMSWHTAIVAHLVWIVPVVTLVMAIQVYGFDPALEEAAFDLGASRLQVLREVTLPILWPGIWSGALFAFLLSWGNFPLSLYTTGADSTVPEWLYAKMVAGYTPMVPTLGTFTVLAAAALLLAAGAVRRLSSRH